VTIREGGEYELEIGNYKNASPEMLALCSLIDEIIEFLKLSPSPLAELILAKYKEQVYKLNPHPASKDNSAESE
jgi:hypothetical protein